MQLLENMDGTYMSWLDRIFLGEVVQDLGVIEEKGFGIGSTKTKALVARRRGRLRFVLRRSTASVLGGGVLYFDIGVDSLARLRQTVEEAQSVVDRVLPRSE